MAVKVLGQAAPVAATPTDLYTVPSGKSAVVSTLVVCNTDTGASSYRIAVRPAGATLADEHYIVHDASIAGSAADFLTVGITLAATDVVTVYATDAVLSFSLFGDES